MAAATAQLGDFQAALEALSAEGPIRTAPEIPFSIDAATHGIAGTHPCAVLSPGASRAVVKSPHVYGAPASTDRVLRRAAVFDLARF